MSACSCLIGRRVVGVVVGLEEWLCKGWRVGGCLELTGRRKELVKN